MLSAAMTITQYLGNGAISRGRLTITPQLNTQVATAPYLKNATDKEAVIQGIDTMRSALSKVQNLTWIKPTAGQDTTAFVNSVCLPPDWRRSMFTICRSLQSPRQETLTIGLVPTKSVRMMAVVVALLLSTSILRCTEPTISLLLMRQYFQE
jgi:hypothetical protein